MTTQVDFLAAMRKGVNADDTANANRGAVREILGQVERDLSTFVGGPVELVWQTRSGPSEVVSRYLKHQGFEPAPRRFQVLAIKRGDAVHDLCEWEEGPLVFPVTLRFSRRTEQAFDEVSLVAAFADLLATPAVGRVLKSLRAESPASPQP